MPLKKKIARIAKQIYGAEAVSYSPAGRTSAGGISGGGLWQFTRLYYQNAIFFF